MGCIDVQFHHVSGRLNATAFSKNSLSAIASAEDSLSAIALSKNSLSAIASAENSLSASLSLVCISEKAYLVIQPEYIWLTQENNYVADVEVLSNTYWKTE